MERVEPLFENGYVLICDKCSKKVDVSSEDVRKDLKRSLADEGIKTTRVISVSCMHFCPEDHIMVGFVGGKQKREEFFAFEPSGFKSKLLEEIKKRN